MAVGARPDWNNETEVRRLQALYQLLADLTRAQALEDVNRAAIRSLLAATTADRAAILTFDAAGVMRFDAWHDLSEEYRASVTGHTPWTKGTRGAAPIAAPDTMADESLRAYRELFEREGIGALAFIPLEGQEGVLGKFMLYYRQPHECSEEELNIARAIAGHVALATERKQAEQSRSRLEAASRHLAAVVAGSADAIISEDLDGTIQTWNHAAEQIFGYSAEEAVGRSVSMLAPPERRGEISAILERVRNGERISEFETVRLRKDGTTIHVSLSVSPVMDAAGTITGASKVARDITDRKQAEQERTQLLAAEQEARRTAELLNRVGPMLAGQLEPEKLSQSVTDLATALVGAGFGAYFRAAPGDGGPSLLLHAISGAGKEALERVPSPLNLEGLAPAMAHGGVIRCDDVTLESRFAGAGLETLRSCLMTAIVGRSGEILGALLFGHSEPGRFTPAHEAIVAGVAAQAAIAMDNARLFEQSQWVQSELKRSNEELRRANQDLETFAYSASHDLQEPLRTIAICAQLLERNHASQLQGEAAELLRTIFDGASRMTSLIQDLLTYTTAAKSAEGPPPSVEPGKVLEEVLATIQAGIEEAGAQVTSESLPAVRIHESRLAQLFQNLIGNALKYRGTAPPHIHVWAEDRNGWTVFSVRDNGIGMDPKYASQIFGMFKRLHSRHEYPGSGIGLAMCQRIVEQYGGRIWVEATAPDKGTTFAFAIPSQPA